MLFGSCLVLFRIVLSLSYPFLWNISREFFPLSLPGHICRRFLRSLFKKSEETRAQFPHLPLLSPPRPLFLLCPLFLWHFWHSYCISRAFRVFSLFLFATSRTRLASSPLLQRLVSSCRREVSSIKCNLFANVSICVIALPPVACPCNSSDPL